MTVLQYYTISWWLRIWIYLGWIYQRETSRIFEFPPISSLPKFWWYSWIFLCFGTPANRKCFFQCGSWWSTVGLKIFVSVSFCILIYLSLLSLRDFSWFVWLSHDQRIDWILQTIFFLLYESRIVWHRLPFITDSVFSSNFGFFTRVV